MIQFLVAQYWFSEKIFDIAVVEIGHSHSLLLWYTPADSECIHSLLAITGAHFLRWSSWKYVMAIRPGASNYSETVIF